MGPYTSLYPGASDRTELLFPLDTLQYMLEQAAAEWGEIEEEGTCARLKAHMHPESFAWAHEHGCPCDCEHEDDSDAGSDADASDAEEHPDAD